eukprot:5426473-Prymnesium_polylepis.1
MTSLATAAVAQRHAHAARDATLLHALPLDDAHHAVRVRVRPWRCARGPDDTRARGWPLCSHAPSVLLPAPPLCRPAAPQQWSNVLRSR